MGKQTVLVVDDTPENVHLLSSVLRSDYKVKVALNGEKAIKIAQSDSQPDLILLDVVMPEMDGYDVCRLLKSDPKTSDIPIIFVTANNTADAQQKGRELGAVDYMTKPIEPNLVKEGVEAHIRKVES